MYWNGMLPLNACHCQITLSHVMTARLHIRLFTRGTTRLV
jgi:hypothetical protein